MGIKRTTDMKILLFLLISVGLFGQSVDALIKTSLGKHPSLAVLESKLMANRYDTLNANLFTNPTLKLGINDIQLNNVSARDIERMQSENITLTQKIPYFGKRDAHVAVQHQKGLAIQAKRTLVESNLALALRTNALELWRIKELKKLWKHMRQVIRANKTLASIYYEEGEGSASKILSFATLVATLDAKIQNTQYQEHAIFAKLSYLSGVRVDDVSISPTLKKMSRLTYLQKQLVQKNPLLKIQHASLETQEKKLVSANLAKYPDMSIGVGYFRRDNFEDYVSLSVGISLPLYGREANEVQKQQHLQHALRLEEDDLEGRLGAELAAVYYQAKADARTYQTLKQRVSPKIRTMIALEKTAIQNGGTLDRLVDKLVSLLDVKTKQVNTLARYAKNNAKIKALLGSRR